MRFLQAQWRAEAFGHKLQQIKFEHPTAEATGQQSCCRSGVCCWRRPGELTSEDVKRLAAHFSITPQEFFATYCVVDDIAGKRCLVLRREHQSEYAGRFLPWDETYSIESPCVFLDRQDHTCKVHDVKPECCQIFKCWVGQNKEIFGMSDDDLKWLGWDGCDDDYDDNDSYSE